MPNSDSKGYMYESLGMYLVPEVDAATKNQNKNTLLAAEAIKAQRIIDAAMVRHPSRKLTGESKLYW